MTGATLTTVIDLGAVGVVAVCALIGRKLGLIRMLSGLITLILAVIGASYIASHFSGQLVEAVAPAVEERVAATIEESLSSDAFRQTVSGFVREQVESVRGTADTGETEDAGETDQTDENDKSLSERLGDLFGGIDFGSLQTDYFSDLFSRLSEEHSLPQWMTDGMNERLEDFRRGFTGTVSQALSSVIRETLRPICYGVLYAVSFIALSIVLRLAFHFLNLLTDAPGVHAVNATGGLVLGVLQGAVILVALSFVLRFAFGSVDGVSDSLTLRFMGVWIPPLRFA